ncbi:MAG: hypothetical protein HPY73_01350 [Methanomassiliicoccales archaeon]|nr:MAG: hypothetical protein HPY73_01350 [Methanomassiliicoccales archaeon]
MAKTSVLKVNIKSVEGYESCAEFDMIVPVEEAKKIIGEDWEGFLKRNRIDPDVETIYIEKVKNEMDRAKLLPAAKKQYTGWVVMEKADPEQQKKLMDLADPDERLTKWDMLSFDEMGETCKKCELSWDEGRGCIGTFGPENSGLPDIARKYGMTIIASIPEAVKNKTKFKVEDAQRLLEEVRVIREKLPSEGKMAVRRYSGVLQRLEKVAYMSLKYKVRFYFI